MRDNKGFTLVELLIVIVILSGVIILTISQVQTISNKSRIKLCKSKLSIIEESVNTYLTGNTLGYSSRSEENKDGICDNISNNVCYTTINILAEMGIIDYDDEKNRKVINPVDNKELNEFNVEVKYNSVQNRYESSIMYNDNNVNKIDNNYNAICGHSDGIEEGNADSSLLGNKDYIFYLSIDGVKDTTSIGTYSIKLGQVGNICNSFNFDDKNLYDYMGYDFGGDSKVYCNYEKKPFYNLTVNKDDNIKLDYDNKNSYLAGSSIEIKYSILNNKLLDNVSCVPKDACKIISTSQKITIRFTRNVELDISSKDMESVGMYYENINDDNYTKENSMEFESVEKAKEYCENNVSNGFIFNDNVDDKYNCYYNRVRYQVDFKLNNNGISAISSINISDGATLTKSTSIDYKYGKEIKIKINYNSGYEYDSYSCGTTIKCSLNNDGSITAKINGNGSITLNGKKEGPKYNVYYHLQDANNANGYTSSYGTSELSVNSSYTDTFIKTNGCKSIEHYTNNVDASYYDSDNTEINCYYDRKLVDVDVVFSNDYIDSLKLTSGSGTTESSTTINETTKSIKYRYGQEIFIQGTYANDYMLGGVTCSNNEGCTAYPSLNLVKITVPDVDKYTVTVNPGDIKQTFNVYYHLQDADNANGYTSSLNGKETISLPANYDDNDPDDEQRDIINAAKYCIVPEHYTYNKEASYLDRSTKELNCYYDRDIVKVTFILSDTNITGLTIVPKRYDSINKDDNVIITNSYSYRFGQEVIMKINGYNAGYGYNGVICSSSSNCTIGKDGTTKIIAVDGLNVIVSSKTN